jgi:hypothetical protein
MVSAINQAEKQSFFLVSFTNLVTNTFFAKFTTLDSDYVFEGQEYESEPRMTVKLPRNDGTLGEEPCMIALPSTVQFAQDVTSGLRYPACEMRVIEVIKGEGAIATKVLRPFRGLMKLARRKVGGRASSVTISALPLKARLADIALGMPCMQNCINRLGDGRCKVVMTSSPRRLTLTVASIDGPKITLSGTIPTGLEERFYQRGYVIRQGFEFEIRDWHNESNGDRSEFFLFRRPPDSWIGQSVVVFSGCDKTPGTCESRYSNISNFNGAGVKMPAYNPIYEDGAARQ